MGRGVCGWRGRAVTRSPGWSSTWKHESGSKAAGQLDRLKASTRTIPSGLVSSGAALSGQNTNRFDLRIHPGNPVPRIALQSAPALFV